jgi:hypothetical protein
MFKNGEKNGAGKEITNEYNFKGLFRNEKKFGIGKITFIPSGDFYEGNFDDDLMNGKGEYVWKNGNMYEGDFLSGKLNGKGIYHYNDGYSYEGIFERGRKFGKGILRKGYDIIDEGIYKDGEGMNLRFMKKIELEDAKSKYDTISKISSIKSKHHSSISLRKKTTGNFFINFLYFIYIIFLFSFSFSFIFYFSFFSFLIVFIFLFGFF